jgi:hypothetical protein
MGGRISGPYAEVLIIGTAAVVLTWLSRAWVIGAISLAMTLGVGVAALLRR